VIATGFEIGAQAARPVASTTQTPVDMTPYAEVSRVRVDVPPVAPMPPMTAPRLSIARRPLLDLPLSAAAAGAATASVSSDSGAADEALDLDSGVSSFDIPAFLRRQEN
jgi:hypothetical protein